MLSLAKKALLNLSSVNLVKVLKFEEHNENPRFRLDKKNVSCPKGKTYQISCQILYFYAQHLKYNAINLCFIQTYELSLKFLKLIKVNMKTFRMSLSNTLSSARFHGHVQNVIIEHSVVCWISSSCLECHYRTFCRFLDFMVMSRMS